MSERDPNIPEKKERPRAAWYDNQETLDALVTLFEAKSSRTEGEEPKWKFSAGHAYRWLFPSEDAHIVPAFTGGKIPSLDSFKTQITRLATRKVNFRDTIPLELQERFFKVMGDRMGKGAWGQGIRHDWRPFGKTVHALAENKRGRMHLIEALRTSEAKWEDIIGLVRQIQSESDLNFNRESFTNGFPNWFRRNFGKYEAGGVRNFCDILRVIGGIPSHQRTQ